MPLSVRTRVEIYLPDQPSPIYQDLLRTFTNEFTSAFGGCTVIRGLDGNYLSKFGQIVYDRINIIYPDTPVDFHENINSVSKYADSLRQAAFEALDEETVLVAVWPVYHSI